MWKAQRQHILETLGREQVSSKKLKKGIDKLSTICYNNNVNKNKSKKEMRYVLWKRK